MQEKIHEILTYSDKPVEEINEMIRVKIKSNDRAWLSVILLSTMLWIGFYCVNRPDRQAVLAKARPLVDSIKNAYQSRLDVVIDSLYKDNYKPKK